MPELPDILAYLAALDQQIGGKQLQAVQLRSAFLVRTPTPPLDRAIGLRVTGFRRLGKRVVWCMEQDLFLVFHLMIAGRFHLKKPGTRPSRKIDLLAMHFEDVTVMVTEAGSKKRASLHLIENEADLAAHDPGGLEVLGANLEDFAAVLASRNHTLKRALTDPRLFSGIGNAYSDEILHAARLSPIKWTSRLTDAEVARLYESTQETLRTWCDCLLVEANKAFPEKVTAFRPDMAVHGRFGKPCPVCQTSVQEIAYASNETNYCPRCQTAGKVLADRQLSRLLRDDWPKTIEELESRQSEQDADSSSPPAGR
ncbi:MAG: formamidopyrimidine-DNA glycosylase [Gemmatimonadetes bacterium]|jgi:formamidopyrimidine-DNA glycosylase|nr:formamidopyrimidine-DNA glycosylase [Gemmatimonadota bacterium]MBT5060114.1 formamidopyrimidine-DNA glycosylase [Gemmatimonadota bacterium]MBT5144219.1 formamidopyrimidine-DNA glycosylase [Gemmatimonadota bacterium]MBT5588755.1 formamidopyrimidine-DNA glycosylase [Gemmatimonadota bacterium]MBT5964527.1 formamidopyrimidine-DNA glycosylase [Gemmatimonadota bacterium]